MTKYERIALSISFLALIVSLGVPVTNYFFFNPIEAELRYEGRLVVTEKLTQTGDRKTGYDIELKNVGKRSLSNIEIGAMTIDQNIRIPTRKEQILTIPIRDFDFKSEGNHLFIRFPGFLGSKETIRVIFDGMDINPKSHLNGFRVDVACNSGNGTSVSIWRGGGAGGD